MSERYWITGVQLGMFQGFMSTRLKADLEHLIEEVIDNQFIGRMGEPYEDYEIVITKKVKKMK